jgi:hypothetical protein
VVRVTDTKQGKTSLVEVFGALIYVTGFLAGAGAVIVPVVMMLNRALTWLRTAAWPEWSIEAVYGPPPSSENKGFDIIVAWFYKLPFELVFGAGAAAIAWMLIAWGLSVVGHEHARRLGGRVFEKVVGKPNVD